ncbi:hypothetical protein NC651_002514 [Populus alba x Populus x berolinensis]|nr:hypothetical protein NC651_002514 [Populus alba x Populus x berolinensis]
MLSSLPALLISTPIWPLEKMQEFICQTCVPILAVPCTRLEVMAMQPLQLYGGADVAWAPTAI